MGHPSNPCCRLTTDAFLLGHNPHMPLARALQTTHHMYISTTSHSVTALKYRTDTSPFSVASHLQSSGQECPILPQVPQQKERDITGQDSCYFMSFLSLSPYLLLIEGSMSMLPGQMHKVLCSEELHTQFSVCSHVFLTILRFLIILEQKVEFYFELGLNKFYNWCWLYLQLNYAMFFQRLRQKQ